MNESQIALAAEEKTRHQLAAAPNAVSKLLGRRLLPVSLALDVVLFTEQTVQNAIIDGVVTQLEAGGTCAVTVFQNR